MVVNLELVLSVLVIAFLWGVLFLYVHRIKVTQESQWGLDPMTEDMPRPPGESLRIRLQSLHNEFDEMLLMIIFAITIAGIAPILDLPPPVKWMLAITSVAIGVWKARKFSTLRKKMHNTRLGFKGERYVGQYLNDLVANGSKVYHDLLCRSANKDFNIDHVMLGPAGVFVIETKARRKPQHLKGKSKAQVTYDGHCLVFPTFTDKHGLEQAERNAKHLSKILTSSTGFKVFASPVLVLPGWYVIRAGAGSVKVLNPKQLKSGLSGKKQLNDEQIARIDHQLKILTVCEKG